MGIYSEEIVWAFSKSKTGFLDRSIGITLRVILGKSLPLSGPQFTQQRKKRGKGTFKQLLKAINTLLIWYKLWILSPDDAHMHVHTQF